MSLLLAFHFCADEARMIVLALPFVGAAFAWLRMLGVRLAARRATSP